MRGTVGVVLVGGCRTVERVEVVEVVEAVVVSLSLTATSVVTVELTCVVVQQVVN